MWVTGKSDQMGHTKGLVTIQRAAGLLGFIYHSMPGIVVDDQGRPLKPFAFLSFGGFLKGILVAVRVFSQPQTTLDDSHVHASVLLVSCFYRVVLLCVALFFRIQSVRAFLH